MQETRARLFDAALVEIGRSGLSGADVTAIASAAGVVRGTFYFHFPTKEHVLVELELNEEARIVAELDVAQTDQDDLVSVLSLLVRHVIAAEQRLGPVVFREMLGLHFSANRPVDDEVSEHPLAEFVIAAITVAQQRRPSSSGLRRCRTRGVLHDRTLRATRHRHSHLNDGGRRCGSVCHDHRQRNGDTMNDTRIDGYRDFLKRRDGEADLLNRRLANREDFFDGLETNPVRSAHPADRTTFLRNMRRRKPESGLDRKMLFLLATAKLNQAERFGVGLGETYGLNSDENLPPERVYLELEEHYHTRLLAYVLDVFDLTFQVVPPPFVMRQFVKTGGLHAGAAGVRLRRSGGDGRLRHVRRTAPRRCRTLRRRTRSLRASRTALQRNPHRRGRTRRLLRVALHTSRARRHALALPPNRKALRPSNRRDQPAY